MNNSISEFLAISAPTEQLIELITQPIYWKNLKGQYIGGNSAFAQCLGLENTDNFIGKTDYDFHPLEQVIAIEGHDKEVIKSGTASEHMERRQIAPNKIIDCNTRKIPWLNSQQEIIGIIAYIKEVIPYTEEPTTFTFSTLIRQATQQVCQKALTQQEIATLMCNYFDSIVGLLPVNIYWADRNGVYLGCNERVSQILGFASPSEIAGKTQYDFHPGRPELVEPLLANDRKVIENAQPLTIEEIGLDPSGEISTYLTYKVPMFDADNQVVGLLGVSFDIVEKKRIEQSLIDDNHKFQGMMRQNTQHLAKLYSEITGQPAHGKYSIAHYVSGIRDYLEKIIALMPGNIYWTDKNGVYLGCNDGILRLIKSTSRSDVVGKTAYDLMPKEMAAQIFENDQAVMDKKEMIYFEEEGFDSNNNPATYLTYKVPLFNPLNKVIGILGISIDITLRKQAERQLQIAKEQAEAANHAKSEFLDNMCHDIRTPLNGIIGSSEILMHLAIDPDQLKLITALNKSGKRLFNFVNEIVEFAGLESGNLPLQKITFSLPEIINAITEMITPEIQHKGLQLEVNYDNNISNQVIGDPKRLERIMLNLVGNAIKFTPAGKIIINVKEQMRNDNIVTICLQIIDSGIGIPEDKIEFIFGKFNRVTASYEGVYKGTGLGLSIVKQFVTEMHGNIEVFSKLNEGSMFVCTLPFELSVN